MTNNESEMDKRLKQTREVLKQVGDLNEKTHIKTEEMRKAEEKYEEEHSPEKQAEVIEVAKKVQAKIDSN